MVSMLWTDETQARVRVCSVLDPSWREDENCVNVPILMDLTGIHVCGLFSWSPDGMSRQHGSGSTLTPQRGSFSIGTEDASLQRVLAKELC